MFSLERRMQAPGISAMDRLARRFVLGALQGCPDQSLTIIEPDGQRIVVGQGDSGASLRMVDWRTYRMMMSGGALGAVDGRQLDPIVVSGSLHTYIWQTARGELVMGGSSDPYPAYTTRSTLDFKEGLLAHVLELFPFLGEVRLMRQWAGMTDMTPDFSPVMGKTHLDNYYIDAGWGTWGFKATPVCGKRMAETVATDRVPDVLSAFDIDRFSRFDQVGERGAASVGH